MDNMTKSFNCSTPGSIMILGEHSILRNHRGHALAINKRVNISININTQNNLNTQNINIKTNNPIIGNYTISYDQLNKTPADKLPNSFKYVLATIKFLLFENNILNNNILKNGFDIIIKSEIPHDFGLGSSGAILSATMGAMLFCLGKVNINSPDKNELLKLAKKIAKIIYPNKKYPGSGYDYAASIFGGFIDYQIKINKDDIINRYKLPFNLILVYSGYKTPTPHVLDLVSLAEKQNPEFYKKEFDKMHQLIIQASKLLKNIDLKNQELINLNKYLDICEKYQMHLENIKVNDSSLNIISKILKDNHIKSKISGAGLGDCVIGLSNKPVPIEIINNINNYKSLPDKSQAFLIAPCENGIIFNEYIR